MAGQGDIVEDAGKNLCFTPQKKNEGGWGRLVETAPFKPKKLHEYMLMLAPSQACK